MNKKTSDKPDNSMTSSFADLSRKRTRRKLVFLVLTIFIGLGLVGSSFVWIFAPDNKPPQHAAGQAQPGATPEERIAALETRLKEDAGNTELMRQLGGLYWQAGRGAEALEIYLKAVEINPGDSDVRQDLALTYYLLGDYNDAVRQMETILQRDSANEVAYFYLGQFYAYRSDEGRDVDKGIEALEKFISLRQEGLEVEKARGMIEELKAGNAG